MTTTAPKTAWLECQLHEDEIREKGKALARAEEERDQNAAKKKAVMAEFKSKDDGLASIISQLTTQINNEREYRNVEVEERPDYERNLMEIYRRDIGERINTRPLTTDELQLKFGFKPEEVPPFRDQLQEMVNNAEDYDSVSVMTRNGEVLATVEKSAENVKEFFSVEPESNGQPAAQAHAEGWLETEAGMVSVPEPPPIDFSFTEKAQKQIDAELSGNRNPEIGKRKPKPVGWTPQELEAREAKRKGEKTVAAAEDAEIQF